MMGVMLPLQRENMPSFRDLILLLSVLLAGCWYHNPYHKPTVEVVNRWSVKDRYIQQTDNKTLPYLAWWHGFNDPTLNGLIDRGLVCNNTINMSRSNIEAAEGELKKIRYQWIPDLDAFMGYSRNPATGFPGLVAVLIPFYTMNIFQQIREQRQAKYALQQVKAEDDAIKLTVIAQISASYFAYLAEKEREHLVQILTDDLIKLASIAEKVYKDGISSDIDPQELYSQANLARGELEVILQNVVVSRNALRFLLDQNPGEIKSNLTFIAIHNDKLIPSSLPLTVLENRPDMRAAENRLRASNEGIGLAASQLLPTLQLDMISGLAAGDNRYILPQRTVRYNDQLFKISFLKFSVLGEIEKARGLNKMSYYNYIDTLQRVLKDTTNALSANDRLTNKLKETNRARQNAAKVLDLKRRLYERGISTYVDMLKSKIILDRVNIIQNQDKLQELLSIVTLYKELAGGYLAPQPKVCDTQSCQLPSLSTEG
jgi:multidrug efflux system outer membrane protein